MHVKCFLVFVIICRALSTVLLTSRCSVNAAVCSSRLKTYMTEFGPSYPWAVGTHADHGWGIADTVTCKRCAFVPCR